MNSRQITTGENSVQVHCRKEVLNAVRDMFSAGNTEVDGCVLWEPQSQRAKLSLGKSCHPGALTHRDMIIPWSNTSKEKAVLDTWASGWGRSLLGGGIEGRGGGGRGGSCCGESDFEQHRIWSCTTIKNFMVFKLTEKWNDNKSEEADL